MKHRISCRSSSFRLALFLSGLFASAGCADSIQLFPPNDGEDASVDSPPVDAGSRDASSIDGGSMNDADGTVDASAPDAGSSSSTTCTLGPSGERTGRCTRENRSCTAWGLALTEITYRGCADEIGFGGNPEITVSTCEQALRSESGRSCGADLSCGARAADDDCCIDRAECSAGSTLRAARLCVPDCGKKQSLGGPVITSCTALYTAAAYNKVSDRPWGLDVIGRECDGDMICGPQFGDLDGASASAFVDSYGHYAFCAQGRIQLITEGVSALPLSDGEPYP